MTAAVTQKFEEMVLQVEDPDTPGTWLRICGMRGVSVTRTASIESSEIPDCDDESVPDSIEKDVRAIDVSASGTGVWAQSSHQLLMDWFYSASARNVRLQNVRASTGATEFETGPAFLADLSNERTKGQKVSASIEIQFNGTPTRTAAT